MALQDLTPQLRTRLSRVERTVGLFVTIATLLLLAGFVYYVYHTAMRKGWFDTKVVYETGLNNAAGLKPGDTVKLMGFDVGNLTEVIPNKPYDYYGVTVRFEIREPNYGYIWTDSQVRVAPADFLGNRYIEVIKGKVGTATVYENNKQTFVLNKTKFLERKSSLFNELFAEFLEKARAENPTYNPHALRSEATNEVLLIINKRLNEAVNSAPMEFYTPRAVATPTWIEPLESPALTDRLEAIVNTVETALPNILNLTNQLTDVLTNATESTSQLSSLLAESRPIVTNLTFITENLREPKGALGDWLLPTNISLQLESTLKSADEALQAADQTLATADKTLANTDTNLTTLVSGLNKTLENLADLTGNLNAQVQSNTNIISQLSKAIVDVDDMVQGLKRHWLLRSAFKTNRTDKVTREKEESSIDEPRPAHPGTRR